MMDRSGAYKKLPMESEHNSPIAIKLTRRDAVMLLSSELVTFIYVIVQNVHCR